MWLSTTGAGLGQPSTNTHRSEDSFRHPPTHRDLRRVKRPARAVPSRSPRSPRVRAKARLPRSVEEIRGETNQARLDFAALRVPKHSVQRHAPRDTTNVPTSPLPPPPLVSEKLIKRAEARESPRTWVNPPKARAAPPTPTPAIVTPALTPPPVVQSEPFSPNTKKSLLSVVKALDAGLAAYSLRKGQHVRVGTSWRRFFELVDEDHSGRLTFDELASAVLGGTLRCKDLSRYDLRVFFSKADDDASGEVTEKEFTSLIYTVQLSNWPDIGNAQCDAAVDTLNKAASHWYNCSGNWYKIFKALDVDDSGELRYDDFAAAVRGSYPPGVDVSSKTLPTATLKGLWKRLDADRSQTVSLQEFMVFFRRHGAQHSMYQPTAHDKELRGLNEAPAPPPFIEESDANVWTTLRLLMRTFASNNRKARQYSKPDIWRDWARLFDVLGGPDRATWSSFKTAAKTLTEINDHALGALWTKADRDQSGEVGRGEFQRCAYTIQVQSWPVLEGDDLTKTVATLNAAAERLHRCGGNWFKIFRLFDDDDSGLMSYEELRKVLRSAYPGLEVSSNDVTDDQVRGLWRGLDDDRSGEASVQEFMIFFRRHGAAHSMFTKPMEAPRLKEDAEVEKVALKPERLRAIVLDLKRALHTYFKRRGMAPKLGEEWKVFFNLVDEDQSGRLDAAELEEAVAVLRVSLSDEDLRGLFACADEDGSGEVTTQEFQHCVYKLELETLRAAWPDLLGKEELLGRAIGTLNAHAEKWHRAGGNWYKIFKRIDADDSGEMTFAEFRHMCRSIYPGLNVDRKLLGDGLLKGLWRAMDADSSGEVTVQEFMVFMRHHAAHLDSMASYTSMKHSANTSSNILEDAVDVAKGTGLKKLALLRDAARSFDGEAPSTIAEWDFEALVRAMDLSEEQFPADDVHAVWRAVAGRGEACDRDGLLAWCRDPPCLKDGDTDDEAAGAATGGAE